MDRTIADALSIILMGLRKCEAINAADLDAIIFNLRHAGLQKVEDGSPVDGRKLIGLAECIKFAAQ